LTWNFTGPTTSSKAQSRPGLPKDVAWDLVGFDGNYTGGLLTHPGFRLVGTGVGATTEGAKVFPITWVDAPNSVACGCVVGEQLYRLNGSSYSEVTGVTFTGHNNDSSTRASAKVIGGKIFKFKTGTVPYVASKVFCKTGDADVNCLVNSGFIDLPAGAASTTTAQFLKPVARQWKFLEGESCQETGCLECIDLQDTADPYYPLLTFIDTTGSYSSVYSDADFMVYVPCSPDLNWEDPLKAYKPPRVNLGLDDATKDPGDLWTRKGMYSPGFYTFAIQFVSTYTGRKTPLSDPITIQITANGEVGAKTDNRPIYYRIKRPIGGDTVRNCSYDKAYVYRSVRSDQGGASYNGVPLHLDRIIDLSNVEPGEMFPPTDALPSPNPNNITDDELLSGIRLMSSDLELTLKEVATIRTNYDTTAPPGGVAEVLGNTLFVSDITGTTGNISTDANSTSMDDQTIAIAAQRGVGELRWSAIFDALPESFPPLNRWIPPTPGAAIIAMRTVGNFIMAFSKDRIYRISRVPSTKFVQVEEMHLGYGIVGPDALEAVGTMVYFVSGGGLKAVSVDGKLDDVTSLDTLINTTWASRKEKLMLAYDSVGQCLTVLNPATGTALANGHAACLWFGTNRVTELVDLPFMWMKSGDIPSALSGVNVRRSLFFGTAVYVVDHERQSPGVSYANTSAINLLGRPGRIVTSSTSTGTVTVTLAAGEEGCAVYNLATGGRFVFNGTEVGISTASVTVTAAYQPISVAPIVMRWTGSNVGFQLQPDQPEFKDFFRLKQVNGARAYVEAQAYPTGINPLVATPPNTWSAELFTGTSSTPVTSAKPTDRNGNVVAALELSPSAVPTAPFGRHGVAEASLSPSFVCKTSGVHLKLLAFSLYGRILDTDRRYT
jgi:hypothetical protein